MWRRQDCGRKYLNSGGLKTRTLPNPTVEGFREFKGMSRGGLRCVQEMGLRVLSLLLLVFGLGLRATGLTA